jgi:galactokinase/mevalonate kinase-like predicted kinase
MSPHHRPWDYLVVTASNDLQADAYRSQIELRRSLGQLTEVREAMVIPDLEGRRIGSGGSTIECLRQVVARERAAYPSDSAEVILARLRVLILHAGGDSRRLPAYSPCGKLFVPLPGESHSALGSTLFDRLAPSFLALPPGGEGQIVVAAGDALIDLDPSRLDLAASGVIALGALSTPEEASRHGVFCPGPNSTVRLFMQKPSPAEQAAAGALTRQKQAVLDIGVMSMDGRAATQLLAVFCDVDALAWKPRLKASMLDAGVDLYREICCALGTETGMPQYLREVRRSGGAMDDLLLQDLFAQLRPIPLKVHILERCSFLHFGATRQLITNGIALLTHDEGSAPEQTVLSINHALEPGGSIEGNDSWVEGCRIAAPLRLHRTNVLTGVDILSPLALPQGACLDISEGVNRNGAPVRFVRCYGVNDTFKHAVDKGATFCGILLARWMESAAASASDLWPEQVPPAERTLWNARVFPAEPVTISSAEAYRPWLWFFHVENASAEDKKKFLAADRYSAAEIATLVDQGAFHARRLATRAHEVESSLATLFRAGSAFSARDLAFALTRSPQNLRTIARVLTLAYDHRIPDVAAHTANRADFGFARIVHSLGTAIGDLAASDASQLDALLPALADELPHDVKHWADGNCLSVSAKSARDWSSRLCDLAFENLQESILESTLSATIRPHNSLRPDETIWGRCPARIELAGGWTDTPPYTLEYGGDVTNTAINLNGQPPIHCYCRIIEEPLIRLNSIDGGRRLEISELAELTDYHRPGDPFALAKAALAISGFAPGMADWPATVTLGQILQHFGGGIELTTLVGIPQGSGLGTSSILGATILGVIARLVGKKLTRQELFHNVLRLEQALTTGGGWQDQVGGCVGGSKITSTRPGLFPDASIHFVPSDVLDPRLNGGCTLLYYTGLTRIAKNILKEIVGGYLDRDRRIIKTLADEHRVAHEMADVMSCKDIAGFGHCLDHTWELQKRLCGTVTNPAIEELFARVRPFVHGMRISGAGSGGFLLMVAKSPGDAAHIRQMLEDKPHNDRSRFFDFEINHAGLEVTTC